MFFFSIILFSIKKTSCVTKILHYLLFIFNATHFFFSNVDMFHYKKTWFLTSSTNNCEYKLEAQWAETVSLTFHSALRKLNTEPPIGASHQVLVIWLNSYKEEDI